MKSKPVRRWTPTDEYLSGVARMIRSAGPRVGAEDPEALAFLCSLKTVLDEAIYTAVQAQKQAGITWASIGAATGTTREAAFQKWRAR